MENLKFYDMIPNRAGENLIQDEAGNITFTAAGSDAPVKVLQVPVSTLDLTKDWTLLSSGKYIFKCHITKESINQVLQKSLVAEEKAEGCEQDEQCNNSFSWDHASALLFFEEYNKNKSQLGKKFRTQDSLFHHIATDMQSKGHNISGGQVRNRFRTLERKMKTYVKNNKNVSGKGRKALDYEEQMLETFGHKHNIVPHCTSGRNGMVNRSDVLKEIGLNVKEAPNESANADESQSIEDESDKKTSSNSGASCSGLGSSVSTTSTAVTPKAREGKTAVTLNALREALSNQTEVLKRGSDERSSYQISMLKLLQDDVKEKKRKNDLEALKLKLAAKKLKLQKQSLKMLKTADPVKYAEVHVSSSDDEFKENTD